MKKLKKPFIGKKAFKRRHKPCRICGENKYELLDVHRIEWGGKYSYYNCVVLCTRCHRRVHSKEIKIIGWNNSTNGRVLHCFIEDKENFL